MILKKNLKCNSKILLYLYMWYKMLWYMNLVTDANYVKKIYPLTFWRHETLEVSFCMETNWITHVWRIMILSEKKASATLKPWWDVIYGHGLKALLGLGMHFINIEIRRDLCKLLLFRNYKNYFNIKQFL